MPNNDKSASCSSLVETGRRKVFNNMYFIALDNGRMGMQTEDWTFVALDAGLRGLAWDLWEQGRGQGIVHKT